jgi:hypothetical protein
VPQVTAKPPAPAEMHDREDFDAMPSRPWYAAPQDGTSATVSGGILTLDAPHDADELMLQGDDNAPQRDNDAWNNYVSNERGWWVEVRMRVDPVTDDQCVSDSARGPALTLWATDDTFMLVRLGFSRSCLALVLSHDTAISMPMDTTTAFHVYRLSVRGLHADVYVDGVLAISYDYPMAFEETLKGLVFGDGQSGDDPTRSYWDYVEYDVSGPAAP